MLIAYHNGNFLPLTEVRISAMDRGFLFGDSIYEVIPVYSGTLFRLEQHLSRLQKSLAAISLEIPYSALALSEILQDLVSRNPGPNEQAIYLQITRGPVSIRDFAFPTEVSPTIFAYCMPVHIATYEELAKGFKAITCDDIRWQHCDIKATTLLANVLMRQKAKLADANEAILINNGEAVEGSSSNLFIVKNECLITPPLSSKILGGITRDLIIELALKNNIPITQRVILQEELFTADEVWLTSSTKEIWPIIECDGKIIGDGKAGKLWQRMVTFYQKYKSDLKADIQSKKLL